MDHDDARRRATDGPQTIATHAGSELNTSSSVAPLIWQTTTHKAPSPEALAERAKAIAPADFYTRYGNPTHQQVEVAIAALEGGEAAMITASGMGAIFATAMSHLAQGDHVVAQSKHYDGTTKLFRDLAPRFGVDATFVDQTNPAEIEAAIRPNTKLLFVETPTNPMMELTDLRFVAAIGRSRGITTIADNTFATPVNQRPLSLGIDVVVHSATKYLGGHSDVSAGAVVTSRARIEAIWKFAIVSGATLGPIDAWLLLRGIRTIGLRVERHNANALALARFLEKHPRVRRVHYPGLASHPQHELARAQMRGFTGMMSIVLSDFDTARRFVTSLRLGTHAASLGGYETLVVHPAAMWALSKEAMKASGIDESLVRLSIGIEDEADLLRDFDEALSRSS